MPIKGVIFDLFGTLVYDRFAKENYGRFLDKLATLLEVDEGLFRSHWNGSYVERLTGNFSSLEENLRWVSQKLERPLKEHAVQEANHLLEQYTLQSLNPRHQAAELLAQLRLMDFKLGLISDCGPAVPHLWERTPFPQWLDTAVFSCREKARKPDLKLYQTCLDRLDLQANQCLYIADGHNQEMEGAKKIGLKPILIWSAIDLDEPDRLVLNDWTGVTIKSLAEVLDYIQ